MGSLQTGHEIVVSPNRDRHPTANKVNKAIIVYDTVKWCEVYEFGVAGHIVFNHLFQVAEAW